MDFKTALVEFSQMLHIGTHALRGVAMRESSERKVLDYYINEINFLLTRLDEVGDEIGTLQSAKPCRRSRLS